MSANYFVIDSAEPKDWDDSAVLRAVPRPPGEDSCRKGCFRRSANRESTTSTPTGP